MSEFNSDKVTSTLSQIVKILNSSNIEYRFLGSVVVAAINGKLHRDLGDLDLIIDANKKSILDTELKKLGYKPAHGMFSFARKYLALEQLEHSTLLGVGYFFGTWEADGSFLMGNKRNGSTIEEYAIKKTKYSLYGIEFFGIPQQAAARGVKESATNPKRKNEMLILKEKGIKQFPNNYIHVSLLGIKADWTYHFSMALLNILGAIRVRIGLSFDPWR